jgi:hypothetical protein
VVDDFDDFDEESFRAWLVSEKNLSLKACGDAVSRLKRCTNIERLDGHQDSTSYFDAILQYPEVESIPKSSRASMFRSCRLYFEFASLGNP